MASTAEEFSEGSFESFVETKALGKKPKAVKRIVFASGKLAVELREKAATEQKRNGLQIISIEQIYPFPFRRIQEALEKYTNR